MHLLYMQHSAGEIITPGSAIFVSSSSYAMYILYRYNNISKYVHRERQTVRK